MLSLAERALGLNGRELRRAFPLFAYLFLTMASSVASKAARDALFLDRYRAIDLPYVDIAIAVLVGIAASLYIWVGHRTNLRNLQVGSLVFFALNALVLLVVGGARRRTNPAPCSSSSTSGSACSRCWRRRRCGRWPTTC